MPRELEEYLTVEEVATMLKIKTEATREFLATGVLPIIYLASRKSVRVRRSDLQRFLDRGGTQQGPIPRRKKHSGPKPRRVRIETAGAARPMARHSPRRTSPPPRVNPMGFRS